MNEATQISAVVTRETKELLERHVRATGVKKGFLIEDALRHHLLALQELPADLIVHPRLVVSRKSGEELLERLASTRPTDALRDLMARDGD
jgi:hypothetical protein